MLKGWSNPLSPEGRANLIEPLPHHISSEAIQVYFRTSDEVARRYLPEGVEPVDGGLGYAYVADMVKVSASDLEQPYANPERTQYGEGLVGFYGRYGNMEGRFSAYIWVTKDWSVVFGQFMGWGKKIGRVSMTKVHPFNPGMGPIGPGTRLRGLVDRHGQRIVDVGIELTRREPDDAVPSFGNRAFLLRHIPSVGPEISSVTQLCSLQLKGVRTVDVWSGVPHLSFGASDNEELVEMGDVEPTAAFYFKRGWTTDAIVEILRSY